MGVKFEDIDYVELHPIEWDGMLFFSDGKKNSKKTFSIYCADIINLKKTSKIKGKILKKADLVVEITFRAANTLGNTENVITIDLDDKNVDDFINRVHLIREKASDSEYWICKVIGDLSLTFALPKEVYIYPKTPFLADYEQLIWYNAHIKQAKKEKNKIISLEALTNYRIFEYNFEQHIGNGILIPLLEDVKIMNNSFTDGPNPIGTYTDYYNTVADNSRKVSNLTIGDLGFFTEGKPIITFRQVGDPDRLVSVIKSIIQQGNIKLADKIQDIDNVDRSETSSDNAETNLEPKILGNPFIAQFPNIVKKSKEPSTASKFNASGGLFDISKSATINCVKCGNNNPSSSKFCNNCGSKLESRCPQCGYVFKEGSKFCNSCGFNLSSDKNKPQPVATTETSIRPDVLKENDIEFEICELFEYGIKISYPTDWTKYDHGLDSPLIAGFMSSKESIDDPFLDGVLISITKGVPRFTTLENLVKQNIHDVKLSNPDFVLEESPHRTSLSREPAYTMVYRDGGCKTLAVLTVRQSIDAGSLIIVLYRALPSSFSETLFY